MSHTPKVLFIGIDAADPTYIDRRIAAGGLPNIARFRRQGVWGRMRSTFPVLSSAAWSTIATGLPPEKHGIFEFFKRKPGTWQDEINHGGTKQGKDIWRIAADHGLRAVSINMPITYPPKPIPNGIVVSGMDTPGEGAAFVAPPDMKTSLLKAVPDYRIELTAAQFKTIDEFLETTSSTLKARRDAAFHLFELNKPELAMVVFTALDRVLHALWKYMDPQHPAFHHPDARKWRGWVDRLYDEVDGYFGELVEWAGPEATVITCSDHGGAAVHGVFFLNRWLMREGYLHLKPSGGSKLLTYGSKAQKWVKRVVPRSVKNVVNKIFPNLYADVETMRGLQRIDPDRTRVYAWRKCDVMRFTLKGREPGGTLEHGLDYETLAGEIKEKLEHIVDPRNGRKPIRRVWTRWEAYPLAGELDDCPDLVIEWDDRIYEVDTTLDNPAGPLFTTEEKPDKPWREEINGEHALYGVFGAKGPNVAQGVTLDDMEITAVAPAILEALGIPRETGMIGKAPSELNTGSPDMPVRENATGDKSTEDDRGVIPAKAGIQEGGKEGTEGVIPAKAGIQEGAKEGSEGVIPAKAGIQEGGKEGSEGIIPAKAGIQEGGDADQDDKKKTDTEDVYTEEEKKLLEKRLRDLGYM